MSDKNNTTVTADEKGIFPEAYNTALSTIEDATILPVQETQKLSARDKILSAATAAFLKKGIRSVTMDSIAKTAGVSKRTVYELFEGKDTLAVATIKKMIRDKNKEIIEIIGNTDSVIEALVVLLEIESRHMENTPPALEQDMMLYYPLVTASMGSDKENLDEYSATCTFLKKGMEQGVLRKDLNVTLIDNFLRELVSITHSSYRIKALNPQKKEILQNIFLPYFRGICTKKGMTLMEKYFEHLKEN